MPEGKFQKYAPAILLKINMHQAPPASNGGERAKHVNLQIHFVHEAVAAKYLQVNKITGRSKLYNANILTTLTVQRTRTSTHAANSWVTKRLPVCLRRWKPTEALRAIPFDAQEV